jgi:YggT family protein
MFIFSNFLHSVASIINIGLTLYMWAFIISALLTWVNPDPYNPVVRFLYNITEPVLFRIRRMVPLNFGGIDLSPMIAIFAIMFLQSFLVPTLHQIAGQLSGGGISMMHG